MHRCFSTNMNWRWLITRSFPRTRNGKTACLTVVATLQAVAAYAEAATVTNIFEPLSTPAHAIYQNAQLVLIICAAIFLVLAYTIFRFDAGQSMKILSRRKCTAAIRLSSPGP